MQLILAFTARNRPLVHLALGSGTLCVCGVALLTFPGAPIHVLTIILGYLALALLAATLAIGPLALGRRRRNPVNIALRRDAGLWARLTGLPHALLGLQVRMGGQVLLYFFQQRGGRYVPLLNLFGVSNDLGLAAALILLGLLLLSNDLTLRTLQGPRWKWLQRANYLLFLLTVT